MSLSSDTSDEKLRYILEKHVVRPKLQIHLTEYNEDGGMGEGKKITDEV